MTNVTPLKAGKVPPVMVEAFRKAQHDFGASSEIDTIVRMTGFLEAEDQRETIRQILRQFVRQHGELKL